MSKKKEILYEYAYNSKGEPETCTEAKKTEQYICPYCGNEMIIKQGVLTNRARHFAHKHVADDTACANNKYYSEEAKKIRDTITHSMAVDLLIKFIETKTVKITQNCNRCFIKSEKIFDNEPSAYIHREYKLEDGFADIALEKDGEVFVFEVCNTHKTTERKNVWWCEILAKDILQVNKDIIDWRNYQKTDTDDCKNVNFICVRQDIYCNPKCKSMTDLGIEFGFARLKEPLEKYVRRNEEYKIFKWYPYTYKDINPDELRKVIKGERCIHCAKERSVEFHELNLYVENHYWANDIERAREMDRKDYHEHVFCRTCYNKIKKASKDPEDMSCSFLREITKKEREYILYKIRLKEKKISEEVEKRRLAEEYITRINEMKEIEEELKKRKQEYRRQMTEEYKRKIIEEIREESIED